MADVDDELLGEVLEYLEETDCEAAEEPADRLRGELGLDDADDEDDEDDDEDLFDD